MQALAESTGLPDASFDLVAYQFVFHECPPDIVRRIIVEGYRTLKPRGILFITDINPRYGWCI